MKIVMIKAAAVAALAVTAGAALAADTVDQTRRFLGHGTLHFPVPAAWKIKTRVEPGRPSTIELSPATGDDFQVILTVFAPAAGNTDVLQPAALRDSLTEAARQPLAQSVEKALDVKELANSPNLCFHYSLTDKDPKESYKYLVQAQARIGTLVAAMTILQRSTDAGPREQAFDIIRGARLVKPDGTQAGAP